MHKAFRFFRQQRAGSDAEFPDDDAWLWSVDVFFGTAFAVEIVLRLLALESRFFFGPESGWNVFDFLLVFFSVTELALSSVSAASFDFSLIRLLRVLRMLRTFRMIRIMRFAGFFRDLRLMLLAIMSSAVPLFWALIFLMCFVFMFAVVFLEAVALHLESASADDPNYEGMSTYFSSLPMAVLTLFMTITGGVSWWDIVQLFFDVSTFLCGALLFLCGASCFWPS